MSRSTLLLAGVCLLAALVHLGTLWLQFPQDDAVVVLQNPAVQEGLAGLGRALSAPYWPGAPGSLGFYRPFTLGFLGLQHEIWGNHPVGYHGVTLLLHVLVTALVFRLVGRLTGDSIAATAAAAVFAVHPVHVEVVAGIVGQGELLAASFFLLACLAYLRGDGGWKTALLIAGAYLLSLMSKEIGVTLPAVLVLLEALRAGSLTRLVEGLRARWRAYAAVAGGLVLYLGIRLAVLGTIIGSDYSPFMHGASTTSRILTAVSLWPEYLRLMLFPADLAVDYGPGVVLPQTAVTPRVLLGLAMGAGALLLAWTARRRAPLVSGGILWFAIVVLPVSQLFFVLGVLLSERSLYLPSVGFALAIAGITAAIQRYAPRWQPGVAVVVALAIALGAARTWTRVPAWHDSTAVLETLAREHPESYRAHWHRGEVAARAGRAAEARDAFRTAVELAPYHYHLLNQYGLLLMALGEIEEAAGYFDRARTLVDVHPQPFINYAYAELERGNTDAAVREALDGVRRFPEEPLFSHILSLAYARRGELDLALQHRIRSIRLHGDAPAARQWLHRAELELRTGDARAARASLEHARSFDPELAPPSLDSLRALLASGEGLAYRRSR